MHLLSFAISGRNVSIAKKNVLKVPFRVGGNVSRGGYLHQSLEV